MEKGTTQTEFAKDYSKFLAKQKKVHLNKLNKDVCMYLAPPQPVYDIAQVAGLLFGKKTKEQETWKLRQKVFKQVFDKLISKEPFKISKKQIAKAQEKASNLEFTTERASKVSNAAVVLTEWALLMFKYEA